MKANMDYSSIDYLEKQGSKPDKVTLKVIKGKKEDKEMNADYLNEKLYYFYNNGGPIMEI